MRLGVANVVAADNLVDKAPPGRQIVEVTRDAQQQASASALFK